MNKIILIGSPGSGKSTLARKLGEKLALEVFHLDAMMWKPGWVMTAREDQLAIQQELVARERWIIDGHYKSTLDVRLQAADTIMLLDLPRWVCLFQVLKRIAQYRNERRPDMADGCNERLDLSFLKFVWEFPAKQRPTIMEKLSKLPADKKIIVLRSRKEVAAFLERVTKQEPK